MYEPSLVFWDILRASELQQKHKKLVQKRDFPTLAREEFAEPYEWGLGG